MMMPHTPVQNDDGSAVCPQQQVVREMSVLFKAELLRHVQGLKLQCQQLTSERESSIREAARCRSKAEFTMAARDAERREYLKHLLSIRDAIRSRFKQEEPASRASASRAHPHRSELTELDWSVYYLQHPGRVTMDRVPAQVRDGDAVDDVDDVMGAALLAVAERIVAASSPCRAGREISNRDGDVDAAQLASADREKQRTIVRLTARVKELHTKVNSLTEQAVMRRTAFVKLTSERDVLRASLATARIQLATVSSAVAEAKSAKCEVELELVTSANAVLPTTSDANTQTKSEPEAMSQRGSLVDQLTNLSREQAAEFAAEITPKLSSKQPGFERTIHLLAGSLFCPSTWHLVRETLVPRVRSGGTSTHIYERAFADLATRRNTKELYKRQSRGALDVEATLQAAQAQRRPSSRIFQMLQRQVRHKDGEHVDRNTQTVAIGRLDVSTQANIVVQNSAAGSTAPHGVCGDEVPNPLAYGCEVVGGDTNASVSSTTTTTTRIATQPAAACGSNTTPTSESGDAYSHAGTVFDREAGGGAPAVVQHTALRPSYYAGSSSSTPHQLTVEAAALYSEAPACEGQLLALRRRSAALEEVLRQTQLKLLQVCRTAVAEAMVQEVGSSAGSCSRLLNLPAARMYF
jgi:hypothetical protein